MNKKVLVFGGGTGLSSLLKGLKCFPVDITAVISVSDSGRSTGKLRKEFHTPAVGDIRKVITNLSFVDDTMKDMLEYRFDTTSDLDGHALGNLILISLLNITGSLPLAISKLSELLHIEHKVLPLSEDPSITLMAKMNDGAIIEDEDEITSYPAKIETLFYKEEPKVLDSVISAIKEADLIIFSMGSLYTSVLPHIIAKEVVLALDEVDTPLMYLCNIVTQPGETDGFSVSDHVQLLNHYLGSHKLDVVIASNSKIAQDVAELYATKERKDPVKIDYPVLAHQDVELIEADLLTLENNTLRHHDLKLATLIFSYLMR